MKKNNNNLLGHRQRQPKELRGIQLHDFVPSYEVSFNKNAFNTLLQSHGIHVIHYRAIPDPRGLVSKGDAHGALNERSPSDLFIYEEAGTVQVLFHTNHSQIAMANEGVISYSTAYITLPSHYENGEPIIVAPWDRFYLKDIEARVVERQLVEASSTGIDRLHYPATCVEKIIDSDNICYKFQIDFDLTEDGDIRWLTQNRPGFDPIHNRGKVYAIRYRYVPFFVVSHIIHEIRIGKVTDPVTFKRFVERFPYQVEVVRERVFRDMNKDYNNIISDERLQYAPPIGGNLGPK